MKIAFTPEVAYRLIKKAKQNFKNSGASQEWKDALDKLTVYVSVKESMILRKQQAWAVAWLVNKSWAKSYGIDPTEPMVKVDGKKWWIVLEFSLDKINTADPKSAFNLVTHELAHALDYVIRGFGNATHDAVWSSMHQLMGGDEKYRFPHRTSLAKRNNKSIDTFYGTGIVAPLPY